MFKKKTVRFSMIFFIMMMVLDVIKLMDQYDIIKEDFDNIMEVSKWPNSKDPMSKLESKVSHHLTSKSSYTFLLCNLIFLFALIRCLKKKTVGFSMIFFIMMMVL
jgi:hypothetical protein